jgi:hypothetical protein
MLVSFVMIILQVLLTIALIHGVEGLRGSEIWSMIGVQPRGDAAMWQATAPAIALMLALGFASIVKSNLLRRILGSPVSGWRWPLVWAAAAAMIVGQLAILLPEWAELLFGIPGILLAFGAVLWTKGFKSEDRELFRMTKSDIEGLQVPAPGTRGDTVR